MEFHEVRKPKSLAMYFNMCSAKCLVPVQNPALVQSGFRLRVQKAPQWVLTCRLLQTYGEVNERN